MTLLQVVDRSGRVVGQAVRERIERDPASYFQQATVVIEHRTRPGLVWAWQAGDGSWQASRSRLVPAGVTAHRTALELARTVAGPQSGVLVRGMAKVPPLEGRRWVFLFAAVELGDPLGGWPMGVRRRTGAPGRRPGATR
ncbi:hypothetical protein [Streptacidiphilus cavernicola]|uniref:Uncharacterized protein n=1 Tax=Streptacidiphilus cavernicola TaxID=3342716 RepID=A0ABV6VYZ5_9ACTN